MVQAQTVASFIRTGTYKAPAAIAACDALLLSQWGNPAAFNEGVRHIRSIGFSKLMAIEIATQFNRQCRERKLGGLS